MTFTAKKIASADIYHENFNHFFTEKLNTLTPEQRNLIPNDLSFKLFKTKKELTAERLNFAEKMWMLEVLFGCNVTIVISHPDGLDKADFNAAVKAQQGKMTNGELYDKLRIKSAFVLGGKQLMQSLMYINHVCCSSIYTLLKKRQHNEHHKRNQKFIDDKSAFETTIKFMWKYEATKRRITSDYGLTMPEWYALMYFTTNEEFAINFYNQDFKYSYNSNKMNLHNGMKRMFERGYLNKRKTGNKDKYFISAKGIDLLDRIFNNILLKF